MGTGAILDHPLSGTQTLFCSNDFSPTPQEFGKEDGEVMGKEQHEGLVGRSSVLAMEDTGCDSLKQHNSRKASKVRSQSATPEEQRDRVEEGRQSVSFSQFQTCASM